MKALVAVVDDVVVPDCHSRRVGDVDAVAGAVLRRRLPAMAHREKIGRERIVFCQPPRTAQFIGACTTRGSDTPAGPPMVTRTPASHNAGVRMSANSHPESQDSRSGLLTLSRYNSESFTGGTFQEGRPRGRGHASLSFQATPARSHRGSVRAVRIGALRWIPVPTAPPMRLPCVQ